MSTDLPFLWYACYKVNDYRVQCMGGFQSFLQASSWLDKNNSNGGSTVIPVCKYTPGIIRDVVIEKKYNNIFKPKVVVY